MSKHIYEKWEVSGVHPLIFGVKQGKGLNPIGFIYGPSHPEASDLGMKRLAACRLCAASPDMLEALRMMRQAVGRMPAALNVPGWGQVVAAMCMANDAIAKATGE